MALKVIFNPLSGKFDYVDITSTSSFAVSVPQTIDTGSTFTVAINTQVCHSNEIVTTNNGIGLTTDNGIVCYVN